MFCPQPYGVLVALISRFRSHREPDLSMKSFFFFVAGSLFLCHKAIGNIPVKVSLVSIHQEITDLLRESDLLWCWCYFCIL